MAEINKRAKERVEKRLVFIDKILKALYGTPDLGNVSDSLEELIYLTIAQRTRINTAMDVYRRFRQKYPEYEDIINVPENELKKILSVGGRGNLRIRAIKEILMTVKQRTGMYSLEFLKNFDEEESFKFLSQLPWVGEKIARCVMLYSLGIDSFPADSNIIRIFTRMGVLDPIIGSLDDLEHRKAQELIAACIPSEIARTMHVNMVVHGQDVCKPGKPHCASCEIVKWCKHYRNEIGNKTGKKRHTIVDLFSGAGGISLGFIRAGFKMLLAVDNNHDAHETLLINNPEIEESRILNSDVKKLKNDDIKDLIQKRRPDVLVAGIPCQGFSMVGYRTKPGLVKKNGYKPEKDPRNKLFRQVLRFVDILKPEFVVVENVPGINTLKIRYRNGHHDIISLLERGLKKRAYNYQTKILDAKAFGIPQNRKRIFCFARKHKTLPDNIIEEMDKVASRMGSKRADISLREAIGDLPPLEANTGSELVKVVPSIKDRKTIYGRFIGNRKQILYSHFSRYHNKDDMKIIRELKQGENFRHLLERAPQVIEGRKKKVYSIINFPDKYYRLAWDAPSRTIVSHLSKDGNSFIHPSQNRSISVREAARIQTFPDDYLFTGSRASQFIQIGNAVPPLLANIIGKTIIRLLDNGGKSDG